MAEVEYEQGPNNARWVVIGFAVLVAVFVAYMAVGMPGMDHGGGDGSEVDHGDMDMGMPASAEDVGA